jgi:hypothetical protein
VDHSKNKTNEDIHIRSEKENFFRNVIFTKKWTMIGSTKEPKDYKAH